MSSASEARPLFETHGIDYIPPEARHGKAWTLLTFWAGTNVMILAISTGALAVIVGLSLPWAIAAIVIGNLAGGVYMALHSVQGPRMGIPQMMQSRAQFGMYGAALPNVIVVLMYIGYFVSGVILGGQAVASLLHVTTSEGIIIMAAIILVVCWFGYDLFHRFNIVSVILSTAIFLALLVDLATLVPGHLPPATGDTPGNILLAISFSVAWQVTYAPYVSDYSRYLPEETPGWKTFLYTYLGAVLGTTLSMVVGALAAVVALAPVSANAPNYLSGLLTAKWLFLLVFVIGTVASMYENLYGPFLTFFAVVSPSGAMAGQKTGRRARFISTFVFAVIGAIIAIYASPHFITDLSNFLVFTLYLLIPWTAINLTDFYLVRHARYDIPELFKVDGKYGKVNWFAILVFALTVGVELPFMNDPAIFVGPVATAMGGADIAWIVGFIFGGLCYYVGARLGWAGARESASLEFEPVAAVPVGAEEGGG